MLRGGCISMLFTVKLIHEEEEEQVKGKERRGHGRIA